MPMDSTGQIKRVGILFSGGPAPAANAVISAATLSLHQRRRLGDRVLRRLSRTSSSTRRTGRSWRVGTTRLLTRDDVSGIRNEGAIMLRTSRANPGKAISSFEDLARLREEREAARRASMRLQALEIDALVSIGGDDTLKTANYLYRMQDVDPGLRPRGRRAPPQDDRQRLQRHRLDVRLHVGRQLRGQRDPQHRRGREVEPRLVRARDHGPQGRMAHVRGRHRRRGAPRCISVED